MALISKKISLVKPSPTLSITSKAKELAAQGYDIISLAAGEPDYDTPDNIKKAAINAIEKGQTKYTAVSGTNELKKAIIEKFKRENRISFNDNEIIVGNGGKQVIYNLFMATINEEDEVIIPAPYWVSYPDMVLLAGGKPVFVSSTMENGFKPLISDIEKAISSRTKWLIINSPNNPSGAVFDKEFLLEIVKLLDKYPNLNIMTDDIYEHIIYDNRKFVTILELAAEQKNRIFTINGVSKSYSMTGWRIGYGAGSAEIIKAMDLIQSQSTSNPCSISQAAALEALEGPQDFIKTNCDNFKLKRDYVVSKLNNIKGLECYNSQGAFYLFPKAVGLFGRRNNNFIINNSSDLASYLLEEAKVAIVPGIAFGLEGYFRISYATSINILEKACVKIEAAINKLN